MIAQQLFITLLLIGLALAALQTVGAGIYDVREAKRKRSQKLHPHARQYRWRPLISVVVLSHNGAVTIENSLLSLSGSSYSKLEIIVVDLSSRDDSRQIVRRLLTQPSGHRIRLIAKRSGTVNLRSLLSSQQSPVHGELVMICQADCLVEKHALKRAVDSLAGDSSADGVGLALQPRFDYRLLNLFQAYESLVRAKARKLASIIHSEYKINGEAVLCKRSFFEQLARGTGSIGAHDHRLSLPAVRLDARPPKLLYASCAVVSVQPDRSLYRLCERHYRLQRDRLLNLAVQGQLFFTRRQIHNKYVTWFGLPLAIVAGVTALFVPLLLSDFAYIAFRLHEPQLLLLSWGILTVYLLLTIWDDELLSRRHKMLFSLGAPVAYGLFYALSFVQLFALLGVLKPRPQA